MTTALACIGWILGVDAAYAQGWVTQGATQASSGLFPIFINPFLYGSYDARSFNDLAHFLALKAWLFVAMIMTYNIVRAGIKLINSQEEDKLSKARRTIVTSVVGVVAIFLVPRLVIAIYTGNAACAGGPGWTAWAGAFSCWAGVQAGAGFFATEISGLIKWVEVLVVPLAMAVIIFTGLQAIMAFGKEDAPEKLRRTVLAIGGGLLIMGSSLAIKQTLGITASGTLGSPDAAPVIVRAIDIVNKLMLFLSLFSVAVVILAGVWYLTSLGNEEQGKKAKDLLGRLIIGTAIIFMSYAITYFAVTLF